jgi:predicted metal-dependent peptidase
MNGDADLERLLSRALLQLRAKNPFFATLALFAHLEWRAEITTAATDGRDIVFNPAFAATLTPAEFQAVLLHEVLHCALLHVTRRGSREPELWNIAADIVVNGMIAPQADLSLPAGAIREPPLEQLAVEEVYEALLAERVPRPPLPEGWRDLQESSLSGAEDAAGPAAARHRAELEAYWKGALRQAEVLARSAQRGTLPAGWAREAERIEQAQLDWRSHLWRFIAHTPSDFSGFDRRFLWQGLYLDAMHGETVAVRIAVDTSGSVDDALIGQFLGEVRGILAAYPQLDGQLWYADAALYGPYPLSTDTPLPQPQGGGGTSFRPFFAALARESATPADERLAVYLTDGYGDFPAQPPDGPVLWVVAPGGLANEEFPFGEVARLV